MNKMGKYIKQKREEKGLTQLQMAKILNTNERKILKLERGINVSDETLIQSLAEVFNTTAEGILVGEDLID